MIGVKVGDDNPCTIVSTSGFTTFTADAAWVTLILSTQNDFHRLTEKP